MIGRIKSFKNRIDNNKDNKTLINNFSFLMLLQIAGYVFPLLTIPYLARVIGVHGVGKIAFAAAVIVWFKTITDWGFNYTATRDVARCRDDPERISEIFSNVLWARLALMCISLFLLLMAITFVPYFGDNAGLLLVSFLLIPGHIFFPDWFFQAMEKMKFITVFDISSKLIFTILIFTFIENEADYILQPLFISMGYIVSGCFSIYVIVCKWGVRLQPPKIGNIILTIKNSTNVFINNIMPNLYNSFSSILLGFLGGAVANGLLDSGAKLVNVSQQFMSVITRVFFPLLSRKSDKHIIFKRVSLITSVITSLMLFTFAQELIELLYTPDFNDAIVVLKIMSFSLFFIALNNIYGINYMLLRGYEKELRQVTSLCSVLGLVLSIPLIYFHGYIGAALTITLTRCLLGCGVFFKASVLRDKT